MGTADGMAGASEWQVETATVREFLDFVGKAQVGIDAVPLHYPELPPGTKIRIWPKPDAGEWHVFKMWHGPGGSECIKSRPVTPRKPFVADHMLVELIEGDYMVCFSTEAEDGEANADENWEIKIRADHLNQFEIAGADTVVRWR